MNCLVTGAAGFIGSHLCERLVADGHTVVGLDCFTPYYRREVKERNLAGLLPERQFTFAELDLCYDTLTDAVTGAEWVFHLAAMPGLVKSWTDFELYNRANILGTHQLLDALKDSPALKRLVYASTSSVYGRYASGDETLPTRPSSPYGITKLAGEQLCRVYGDEFGLPVVVLRYFSVYGPRQRPDMGYHQFIDCLLTGRPIRLTGDGLHLRGNTFVADCVDATVRAAGAVPGEVFNVGGGEMVTVQEVIRRLERITGKRAVIDRQPPRKGDQIATGADVTKITRHLGWRPQTRLDDGLTEQVEWQAKELAPVAV
jgi:nucleoside-diphosphate-sugar epimerase